MFSACSKILNFTLTSINSNIRLFEQNVCLLRFRIGGYIVYQHQKLQTEKVTIQCHLKDVSGVIIRRGKWYQESKRTIRQT